MSKNSCDLNQAISDAINYLGINLCKELSKEVGNVFFSPLSISSALAIAFLGSSSETAKEITSVLGYERANLQPEHVKSNFQHLFSEINNTSEVYTLNSANVVLSDKEFLIEESFKKTVIDYFETLFVDVDFVNGLAESVVQANDWVKTKTNNRISNLIDSLDSDTKIVILNAIYFKGLWLHPFKEKSTFLQYFYNNGFDDEPKLVEMMHLKEKFLLAEDVSYKALELPYKGGNLAMLFLLPNTRDGVEELEKQVSIEFLKNVKTNMRQTEVEVALPKLHLEYTKSLKGHFQNLGMKKAFSSAADFNQISKNEDLFISEILHKAVLDVTEEGTEAAAATAVVMARYCLTYCPEFIIDHPFLFLIKDSKSDIIFFMGKVVEL